MNKIFAQLVKKRGLDPSFLQPQYENLIDPYQLPDIQSAIKRIRRAIQAQEKILIYGDYDADGVTASTVMEQTLIFAGVRPEDIIIMLPDRFTDGYGMSPKLIKRAQAEDITLVITVDCGSHNHEIVDELNTLKIDSIVTDHHETPDHLPEAVAVINPKRQDRPCPELANLAGVGVAFKLAQALVKEGAIKAGQEKWLLDLVLIGTICDSMLLTGENRILCYYGLKVLKRTRRPGLKELMRRAGVKTLNSEAIGFQIGPRLNAAGRLDTAEIALNLLRTNKPTEAASLANQLEELNKKRKTEQLSATREIKERGIKDGSVIIETGHWHEGIIGIVAGHLVEDYAKPAFVLTEVENNIYKGSGRSFGDFNLAKALDQVRDTIIGGGGHAGAAGVKIKQENLYAFREQINAYYDSLKLKNQSKYLKPIPDLTLDDFADLSLELLEELRVLEPYGPGNEEPIFRLTNVKIAEIRRMGADQNHLRLDLVDKNGKFLKLLAFYAPEKWLQLTPDTEVEPIVKLMENDFNGVKSLEARIFDLAVL
ncbi:MAG: single-stranded-DNA-specific exonuclease RecJ [Candidatus Saccharibacteria bacterium]|nr:single-stranded-DNA-specific exonuclease RecJ [Candidatus Saccharibacteria bacterium]